MSYAQHCGPRAVAAVANLTPTEAAAALVAISKGYGEPEPTVATEYHVVIRTLMALGLRVESWWPSGELRTGAGLYRKSMMTPWRRLPREPETVAAAREIVDDAAPEAPALTVAEWCRRFPRGTWVLSVSGHVLVASGGRVVEGDPRLEYGDHRLVAVEKILNRRRTP